MAKTKKPPRPSQRSVTREGRRYHGGISQDLNGYYAHTHRARSKSYPSIKAIPASVLKFIESTG